MADVIKEPNGRNEKGYKTTDTSLTTCVRLSSILVRAF